MTNEENNPGSPVPGSLNVSNAEFIAAIFHAVPESATPIVCSKIGDPTIGGWIPKRALSVEQWCASERNNYINSASMYPEADGSISARKGSAAAFHALMLDDIGTKIPKEHLAGVTPSWRIETSPGNYQIGFILAVPVTDAAQVSQLQNAVIAKGLSDAGAKGMTRWVRLPMAVNGKDKHKTASGQPFQCRLDKWNPEVRYTFDGLVAVLGLTLEPAPSHSIVVASKANINVQHESLSDADSPKRLKLCAKLLEAIPPGCGRAEWINALMAVFHHTEGSAQGFQLIDMWSSEGQNYPGADAVGVQWRSFRLDIVNPVTIWTLVKMARAAGADVAAILSEYGDDAFEDCEGVVVHSNGTTVPMGKAAKTDAILPLDVPMQNPRTAITNALDRFSLRDHSRDLEKYAVDQIPLLGQLALMGQATVFFAAPNTGKTLITLSLLIKAIKLGNLDPEKTYYINVDDTGQGLITKLGIADEYRFHMLADGYQGFQAGAFMSIVTELIESDQAKGVVVILDTLKKFTDLMDKSKSSRFTQKIREFVIRGGTLVGLAHTNKNTGRDGKPVYGGTSDILDDVDCAYILATVSQDANEKVIEFSNIKRRGHVVQSAAYRFTLQSGISYDELLLSVELVDDMQVTVIKQIEAVRSDTEVIGTALVCINEGINTKMHLVDAVAKRSGISKRSAIRVIERYTGEDATKHRWKFTVRERGAKVFVILGPLSPPSSGTV